MALRQGQVRGLSSANPHQVESPQFCVSTLLVGLLLWTGVWIQAAQHERRPGQCVARGLCSRLHTRVTSFPCCACSVGSCTRGFRHHFAHSSSFEDGCAVHVATAGLSTRFLPGATCASHSCADAGAQIRPSLRGAALRRVRHSAPLNCGHSAADCIALERRARECHATVHRCLPSPQAWPPIKQCMR